MNAFPDYDWLPWKFINTPKLYWEDISNQKKFVKWIETELNIKEMDGWYNVSLKVTPTQNSLYLLSRTFQTWEAKLS